MRKDAGLMKNLSLKVAALVSLSALLSSCGIPTAAVRTARNAMSEVSSLYDGTSSAYQNVQ